MFQTYDFKQQPKYTGEILSLNLSTVEPCVSGPKRPHDRVTLKGLKEDWNKCLKSPLGFKGFGISEEKTKVTSDFTYQGKNYTLKNGSVIIAAITSCTNTSNPESMLAAGLLAQNAVKKGLKVNPYIKTTLSPGSGVVTKYFEESGLDVDLKKLGFDTVGYGCMACIGNT
jgi:aconitate hydratase